MSVLQKQIVITTALIVIGAALFIFLQPAPGPCNRIRTLCESRNDPERQCFRAVLSGQTVDGITVKEDLIQACKERQNKRRSRRARGIDKEV